jgi:hypothetical protein
MTRTDTELLIASRDDAGAFRELYDRWADRLGFMPTPDDRGIVVEIWE